MISIKARGKRIDNEEWVEGSFHTIQGDTYIIAKDTGHFSISHGEDIFITAYIEAVIPETVGQFTGLLDKKGKEIYEGDIVEITTQKVKNIQKAGVERGQIVFNNIHGGWGWEEPQSNVIFGLITSDQANEIIGNVYDNPEFLGSS